MESPYHFVSCFWKCLMVAMPCGIVEWSLFGEKIKLENLILWIQILGATSLCLQIWYIFTLTLCNTYATLSWLYTGRVQSLLSEILSVTKDKVFYLSNLQPSAFLTLKPIQPLQQFHQYLCLSQISQSVYQVWVAWGNK